jgi:hypothetical protein
VCRCRLPSTLWSAVAVDFPHAGDRLSRTRLRIVGAECDVHGLVLYAHESPHGRWLLKSRKSKYQIGRDWGDKTSRFGPTNISDLQRQYHMFVRMIKKPSWNVKGKDCVTVGDSGGEIDRPTASFKQDGQQHMHCSYACTGRSGERRIDCRKHMSETGLRSRDIDDRLLKLAAHHW